MAPDRKAFHGMLEEEGTRAKAVSGVAAPPGAARRPRRPTTPWSGCDRASTLVSGTRAGPSAQFPYVGEDVPQFFFRQLRFPRRHRRFAVPFSNRIEQLGVRFIFARRMVEICRGGGGPQGGGP